MTDVEGLLAGISGGISRRKFLILGGSAASAVLLTSCGARGGDGAGSGTSGGAPRAGGTFIFTSTSDANVNLDVHAATDVTTYQFVGPLYSKLIELETGPDLLASQELVPDLARSWEVSPDGLTYTFHLRDDVRWHDIPPVNGRPFTSDDVLATFEDVINRPARQAWMFQRVAEMQAPDDHTFVVRMNQVYAPFLTYMAHAWNVILPREHVERKFDIEKLVIGTGPFMFDSYERGEQIVRVRNPNYFIKGKPYLDEIDHVIIPDIAAAVAAFVSGRIDSTLVPNEELERFEGSSDVTLRQTGWTPVALYLHSEKPPFIDLRVRRAIALGIDFEGMAKAMYRRPHLWQLSSSIPPSCGEFALTPDEIRQVRPFNPDESRRLLAEAGYPNGFSTSMLVQDLSPHDVGGAEFMIQDLREIGIDVEIQVADLATSVERQVNGQFEMSKSLKAIDFQDTYLNDFVPGARLNYARISNPRLNELIEQTRTTLDRGARVSLFHDIARHMETEVVGAIYGVAYWSPTVIRNTTHDYHPSQFPSGRWWADVWVDG